VGGDCLREKHGRQWRAVAGVWSGTATAAIRARLARLLSVASVVNRNYHESITCLASAASSAASLPRPCEYRVERLPRASIKAAPVQAGQTTDKCQPAVTDPFDQR
jgi:hypothetical protein